MAFELVVLLCNVAIPAALTPLAAATAWATPKSWRRDWSNGAILIGGSLAVWAACAVRNEFSWWPADSWSRVPIGGMLVAIVAIATAFPATVQFRWLSRSLAILLATWLCLPSGEGYADLMPAMPGWQLVIVTAAVAGWWAIDQIHESRLLGVASAWVILFAAGTFLVGQSFAKLAEIMLAIGTVWLIVGPTAAWFRMPDAVRLSSGSIIFMFAASLANGQFNSYLGLPDLLSELAMFGPLATASVALIPWRVFVANSTNIGDHLKSAAGHEPAGYLTEKYSHRIATALSWLLAIGIALVIVVGSLQNES